jgi:predicted DNA-binding ribbon-helix-helix protein
MNHNEMKRKHKMRTHVRFKNNDYEIVEKVAKHRGVTIPELIRNILKIYLNIGDIKNGTARKK